MRSYSGGLQLHFHEEDWARIEHDYEAWWRHELGRPLVLVTGREYDPDVKYPEPRKLAINYPLDMPFELVVREMAAVFGSTRYYGDAYPRWWINFGPGFIAAKLGAKVHMVPETVWFSPSESVAIRDLVLTPNGDNVWWQRLRTLVATAVEAWQGRMQVVCPDLGGNLDILASLRTTEGILYDLSDSPEAVDRLTSTLTGIWLECYDEMDALIRPTCPGSSAWAPIWSKGTNYMLQSDLAYMISPDMFERFVVPDLVACCDHLDHGFYHLDGPGQIPHVNLLLSIPRLAGIQWIPGDGNPTPDRWPDLLRRIISGGKLCQVYVSAEGALRIVRELGGKGFMLVVRDEMTGSEADAFLAALAREGISR